MKHGSVIVEISYQAGMATANTVNVKQRELVDCTAFQSSTFRHRNISQKIQNHRGNNRRRLDSRAIIKSQSYVPNALNAGRDCTFGQLSLTLFLGLDAWLPARRGAFKAPRTQALRLGCTF